MILENCVMAPVIDADRSPIVLPVRDEQTAERMGDAYNPASYCESPTMSVYSKR